AESRDEQETSREERGERNGRGGRSRGGRGRAETSSRRPQRVEDEGAPRDAAAPTGRRSREEREPGTQEKPTRVPAKSQPGSRAKADAVVVKVEEVLPVAEDRPLAVQKVEYVDDDAPVVVAPRKKLPVRVQEDTDAADEPLKVQKLSVGDDTVETP